MGRQARRFITLLLATTYPVVVCAQAGAGVASLVRDVLSISRGQAAPHPLAVGEPVTEGEQIQTAATGAVNVNFPNGTAIAALRQADITFGEAPAVAGQGLAQPLQGLDLVTLSPGVFRVSVGLQPTTVRTRRGGAFLLQGQGGPATALIEEQADGSVTVSTLTGSLQVASGGNSVVVGAGSSVTLFNGALLSAAAIVPMSAQSQVIAGQFAAEIGPVTTASAAPAAGGSAGAVAGGLGVSPLVIGGVAAAAIAIGVGIAASDGGNNGNPGNTATGTSTSTNTN
ncbi:MAG TPA: hypothetical protein VGV37_15945 [Aliidongia sp.]|uniref:hypothetical protein n=1 Tax=Aliidongia sp. TaxID=1914230 RepID=UPI002DDCF2A0|nr:hypothetical protein [Aliidongia sp.]HEV2676015.1 hypothetical protein [Aliidongia sp.]